MLRQINRIFYVLYLDGGGGDIVPIQICQFGLRENRRQIHDRIVPFRSLRLHPNQSVQNHLQTVIAVNVRPQTDPQKIPLGIARTRHSRLIQCPSLKAPGQKQHEQFRVRGGALEQFQNEMPAGTKNAQTGRRR